jgi:phosphohistidine phosphatase
VQVFLIRHAKAIDETLELRDPARHLTAEGREQAKSLGDRLRWYDCAPTHVFASPLVRAVQTAELVVAGLGCGRPVEILTALAPDESPREVAAALAKLPADAIAIAVGHEPGLSALGALLVGNPEFPAIEKAMAARIVDGKLRWRFAWNAEAPEPAGS